MRQCWLGGGEEGSDAEMGKVEGKVGGVPVWRVVGCGCGAGGGGFVASCVVRVSMLLLLKMGHKNHRGTRTTH